MINFVGLGFLGTGNDEIEYGVIDYYYSTSAICLLDNQEITHLFQSHPVG